MRRLIRLKEERGATAVLVAVLMVPLLCFGALAIDVGQVYAERRQLQNGADAAALAIAQTCSQAATACSSTDAPAMKSTYADPLANANANDNAATVNSVTLDQLNKSVDVEVQTKTSGGASALTNILAPLFGINTTQVKARATAIWGPPAAGDLFPMAVSKCRFTKAVGTPVAGVVYGTNATVNYTIGGNDTCKVSGADPGLPGGYGWTNPTNSKTVSSCDIQITGLTELEQASGASLGNSVPQCSLDKFLNKISYMPLYDSYVKCSFDATKTCYHLMGIAAFYLTGYNVPGGAAELSGAVKFAPTGKTYTWLNCAAQWKQDYGNSGSASAKCVQGIWLSVMSVSQFTAIAKNGFDTGVTTVALIN
ncbi:MAG: pilus assembly protein TadG-related protein [Agromyces sp.]